MSYQIEERAIQELLLQYKARDNPDELIVVERATKVPVAAPTWKKHSCLTPQPPYNIKVRSSPAVVALLWAASRKHYASDCVEL